MNPDKVIGDNIAARRRMLNLSRAALGRQIFYTEDWVRRVELGRQLPASVLPKLAVALQLNNPLILLEYNAFRQHDTDFG